MKAHRFLLLSSVLILACGLNGCIKIEDGEKGVSMRFGRIAEKSLGAGMHLQVPIIREVEVFNVKTQRRSLDLEIPSAEGLMVRLQATLLFRPDDVVFIRINLGRNYVENVVDTTLIDTFRGIIQQQRVEGIIKNQKVLTQQAMEALRTDLGERHIAVENLFITGLALPTKFREAVERKLGSEQKALQKEFELKQARKDAEIEVARAEGAAKAQEIVRSTLSSEYLQYLWIKTLNENPNVIYVATEANMPMFRTQQSPGPRSLKGK